MLKIFLWGSFPEAYFLKVGLKCREPLHLKQLSVEDPSTPYLLSVEGPLRLNMLFLFHIFLIKLDGSVIVYNSLYFIQMTIL